VISRHGEAVPATPKGSRQGKALGRSTVAEASRRRRVGASVVNQTEHPLCFTPQECAFFDNSRLMVWFEDLRKPHDETKPFVSSLAPRPSRKRKTNPSNRVFDPKNVVGGVLWVFPDRSLTYHRVPVVH
jgi:hypothetical protein